MEITIFDKILGGEIPADTVYEDEHVLAFKDIQAQAPVHVLVIPKKKLERFQSIHEFSAEEIANFFLGVRNTAEKLGLQEGGYRIVINNGRDAMQTVEYLHAHILGGRSLLWPPG